MSDAPLKSRRHPRRRARLVDLQGREPDGDLSQFLLEERSRRSFGLTGYLVSGGGASAISCWFAINGLYVIKAPAIVLRLLLVASGIFLLAVVIGFFAALAGYKAFDIAASLPAEDLNGPYNRADRWLGVTTAARIVAAILISIGGLMAFTAYLHLIW
ncbi:MAG: hypothetical protein P4M09_11735 [Devosia sp.]|nr:hypothetical protein [Devosia sp.]